MTCPKCKVEVPEGMQFCIECGAVLPEKPLRPPAPVSPPKAPQLSAPPPAPPAARPPVPTSRPAAPPVAPKPATPVSPPAPPAARPAASPAAPASRATPPATAKDEDAEFAMPGRGAAEVEDFQRPRPIASAPGGVVCRFCKGPLDLSGDFCEQCGAPVEDAAPPGMVKPKSMPAPAPAPSAPAVALAPPTPPAAAPAAAAPAPTPRAAAVPPAQTAPAASAPKAVPPAPKPAAPPPRPQPSPEALTMRRIEPLPAPPHLKAPAAPPSRVPAKPAAPAADAAKAAEAAGPAVPAAALEPAKKPALPLPLIGGVAVVVLGGAAAAWYFMRSRPVPQQAPPPPTASAPATAPAQAPQPAMPAPAASAPAATAQPKTARVSKPAPAPAPAPVEPATNPQQQQIMNFQNQAREAYAKGNYAEPADASAIAYSRRALVLNSADQYSKTLLENSVNGGKYQVQQAISKKDFAAAHRVADAMAQLLPGRSDITGLKEDITAAERAEEAARRPVASAQGPRFRVYHMHTEKSPADKGPYCLGTLTLVAQHLKFTGETASDGQNHTLDIACSDVHEIKKNARVASKQGGFHVRTAAANINFAPEDASAGVVPALASGCAK